MKPSKGKKRKAAPVAKAQQDDKKKSKRKHTDDEVQEQDDQVEATVEDDQVPKKQSPKVNKNKKRAKGQQEQDENLSAQSPKAKKLKVDDQKEQAQSDESLQQSASKLPRNDDGTNTFLDKLRNSDSSLEALQSLANDDECFQSEFLTKGGQVEDLLSALDRGEQRNKKGHVVAVFDACQAAFSLLAAGGKHREFCVKLSHELLHNHMRYIMLLLSPTNTAQQAKSTLDLLSSMVVSDSAVARDVLNKLDLDHDSFQALAKRRSKDVGNDCDVRTKYIHFMLSFLFSGNVALAKEFLEKKSKFGQIFPDLDRDSASTVTLVLNTLQSRVLEQDGISKTAKMKLLSANNLSGIFKVLKWKGLGNPDSLTDPEEVKAHLTSASACSNAASNFLTSALTSPRNGVIFRDPAVGTSGQSRNHLLLSLLRALDRPWEEEAGSCVPTLVAKALSACPDQLRPYLATVEKVWQPRESRGWMQVADFLIAIMREQDLSRTLSFVNKDSSNLGGRSKMDLLVTVAANLGLPDRLFREVVVEAIKSDNAAVRAKGAQLGAVIVENASKAVETALEKEEEVVKKVLERWRDRLPKPDVVAKAWSSLVESNKDGEVDSEHVKDLACLMGFFLVRYPDRYVSEVDPATLLANLIEFGLDDKVLSAAETIFVRCLFASGRAVTKDNLKQLLKMCLKGGDNDISSASRSILAEHLARKGLLEKCQVGEVEGWTFHMKENVIEAVAEAIVKNEMKLESEEGSKVSRLTVSLIKQLSLQKSCLPYLNKSLLSVLALQKNPFDMCNLVLKQKNLRDVKKEAKKVLDFDISSFIKIMEEGSDNQEDLKVKREELKRSNILRAVESNSIMKVYKEQMPETYQPGDRELMVEALLDAFDDGIDKKQEVERAKNLLQSLVEDLGDENNTKLSNKLLSIRSLVKRLIDLVDSKGFYAAVDSLVTRYSGLLSDYERDEYDVSAKDDENPMLTALSQLKDKVFGELSDNNETKSANSDLSDLAQNIEKKWRVLAKSEDTENISSARDSLMEEFTFFEQQILEQPFSYIKEAFGDKESFAKLSKCLLKHGLKPKLPWKCRSSSLRLLDKVCLALFADKELAKMAEEVANLILGHSGCLETLGSSDSSSYSPKCALLRLLTTLAKSDPGWLRQDLVKDLLACYNGTLSKCDRAALQLLHSIENRHESSLSQVQPCVLWGDSARGYYGASAGDKNLWKVPKASEILGMINAQIMEATAEQFPQRLTLDPKNDPEDLDDSSRYDPRFFLPLLSRLCAPGAFVDRHLKLVEQGGLSLAIGALSSLDGEVRTAGYKVIGRMYKCLSGARLASEKKVWLHLIDLIRNGVKNSGSKNITSLRLPSIVSVFLVSCCSILHSPLHPMFKPVSNYVLAKPTMELFKVPDFLRLLHSASPAERVWILSIVRDGMRDGLDFHVAKREHAFKLSMAMHDSQSLGDPVRTVVRQLLARACSFRSGARELVCQQGVLQWVQYQLSSSSFRGEGEERKLLTLQLLDIVRTAFDSIILDQRNFNKSVEKKMEVDSSSSEDSEKGTDDEREEKEAGNKDSVLPVWIKSQFNSTAECFVRTVEKRGFPDENGAVLDKVMKLKARINTLC